MDIKAEVEKIVKQVMSDEKLLASLKKDGVKTIKELVSGISEEQAKSVAEMVLAKVNIDSVTSKLGGLGDLLKKK